MALNHVQAHNDLKFIKANGKVHYLYNELPALEFDYVKLKTINMDGVLNTLKPIDVCHDELMIHLSKFSIFLNEETKQLTIGLDHLSNTEVEIRSKEGRLMTKVIINDLDCVKVEVDVSKFPSGTYIASDGINSLEFTIDQLID